VFQPRPSIDKLKNNVEWAGTFQANIEKVMTRPAAPTKSVSV
jgi:hypothetical protein